MEEKKLPITIEPNQSAHQEIIFKVCKAHSVKSLELSTRHIALMSDCISEYIAQQPQTGAMWVKATTKLPTPGKITWRWLDKAEAYSGYDEKRGFIYGTGGASVDPTYYSEIEWLDEPGTAAGREEDALAFAEWLNDNYISVEMKDEVKVYVQYGPQEYHKKKEYKIKELYQEFKQKEK